MTASELQQDIAFQIRALRRDRGLTQEALGERCGMLQAAVARIESAKNGNLAQVRTLLEIANGTGARLVIRFADVVEEDE